MKIEELQKHEQVALGGLIRMMIRSDGDFTEEEEEKINSIGEGLGGRDQIWHMISVSAQECPTDEKIRAAVPAVERQEVRDLIRMIVKQVAGSDGVTDAEQELMDWLKEIWG